MSARMDKALKQFVDNVRVDRKLRELLQAIENFDCHNQDSRHFEKLDGNRKKEEANCLKKLSDIRAIINKLLNEKAI